MDDDGVLTRHSSKTTNNHVGVLLGSILGSLIFLLFVPGDRGIDDFSQRSSKFTCAGFESGYPSTPWIE